MLKRVLGLGVVFVLLIGGVCPESFAQGIELYPGLLRNAAMSEQALENWRTSFENLKQGLAMIAEGLLPDQQALINQAIAMIDMKLTNLQRIDVYTIAENAAGEAFPGVRDFYKTRMALEEVDNTLFKQQLQTMQDEGISPEMYSMFPLPASAIEQLLLLIDQNKFQAASGGSGKSRISILTVYVNPQTNQVVEGTTVVIATDK